MRPGSWDPGAGSTPSAQTLRSKVVPGAGTNVMRHEGVRNGQKDGHVWRARSQLELVLQSFLEKRQNGTTTGFHLQDKLNTHKSGLT